MGSKRIRGRDLRGLNFPSDTAKSIAVSILSKHYKHVLIEEKLLLIQRVLNEPEYYLQDPVFRTLSAVITGKPKLKSGYEVHKLMQNGEFTLVGQRHIQQNAIEQMELAMRLPVAVKGALMPDAHHGFGLPIGGVLATENSVIPYAVGLDIGCRMALSVFAQPASFIDKKMYDLEKALRRFTHFGNEGTLDYEVNHEVLERDEFNQTPLLNRLHSKAWYQLGSSGTGNHFVEFGYVELSEGNKMGLPAGRYAGLLSHSGSRGLGAAIASVFTKTAIQKCRLPDSAKSLAWLNMDEDAGKEYWMSMNLAGDYARACHEVIHEKLTRVLGLEVICHISNHHNYAWKEIIDGKELIVHRKGATPAHLNEPGIIPGSMTGKGFIVYGKGNEKTLQSASHGAGRKFSRKQARESISKTNLHNLLKDHKVSLIGGSVEESPSAYKNIEEIIQCQSDLVSIEGVFTPKIVRMNKS